MIRWPETLPRRMERNDFSKSIPDARLSASSDAGGGKMRRRLSYMPQPFRGSIIMTTAQRIAFERFVDVDLGGGVKPFVFPAQGEEGEWICQLGRSMPEWSEHAPGHWRVTLDVVKLP